MVALPESRLVGRETDPDTGDEYFVYENVPVFDSHIDDEGVEYNKDLLERIANNNNMRIADTGDLVPIVEHHTDDDNDPETDPEIFGYAGPFNVQRFGKVKPRWAIYAQRWKIRADKHDEAKKRPRRSVEIWPEDRPENRYIDPIALLGAETPRRDLGLLRYSKPDRPAGKTPIRYSIPSGTNTFTPAVTNDEPAQYSRDGKMLSPDELTQIIEALKPQIESAVSEALNVANPIDEDPLADEMPVDDELPIDDELAEPDADGLDLSDSVDPAQPAEDGGLEDGLDDEDAEFGGALAQQFMKRYMKDGGFDRDGAIQYMDAMEGGDRDILDRYMKNHCDDDDAKEKYAKCCGKDISDPDDKMQNTSLKEKYRKQRDQQAAKYRKLEHEHKSLKRKYSKMVERVAEVEAQKAEETAKARYAKRHAHLVEVCNQDGFIFDPTDEMDRFGLATCSDEKFEEHVEGVIKQRYQKVPNESVGRELERLIEGGSKQYAKGTKDDEAIKYSNAARKRTLELREKGINADFRAIREHMLKNKTTTYEPPAVAK